jgi:uncharacterized protein (DUF488 family)
MTKPLIYTIGHSTHPVEYFLELISHYKITCVVDVRSLPASRFNPQYNKSALSNFLGAHGITYLHFGEEFGARQSDEDLLDEEGRVDFEKIRRSDPFKKGMDRLSKGVSENYTIALMCSEADPLQCHRFAMISVALTDFDVRHILKDKTTLTQEELEDALLKMYVRKLPATDLFAADDSRKNQLRVAFRLLSKEVAYSPKAIKSKR